MDPSIAGKRVLVTGASGGIGGALAGQFAAHGARVGLHYRSRSAEAEALAGRLGALGAEAATFQADFLEPGAPERLAAEFARRFGGCDVLVLNSGGALEYKHFGDLDETVIDGANRLNFLAPFLLARAAFAKMKERGWGRIVHISTCSVKFVGPNNLHYTTAKAAMETAIRGLAKEGAAHNVLANNIRCGYIDSGMSESLPGYSKERAEARVRMIPVGRPGAPDDIARMALYLASSAGDFITGQELAVSGGE